MELNWREIDRWIFGEAWTGSQVRDHVEVLCEQIGPRWASSERERQAVEYLREQFAQAGLADAALEEFVLRYLGVQPGKSNSRRIWRLTSCPTTAVHRATSKLRIVNAGYGTEHEVATSARPAQREHRRHAPSAGAFYRALSTQCAARSTVRCRRSSSW